MKRVIRRYEVTDEEWERLKKYFPVRQEGTLGRPRKEPREILDGIFWIARSGMAGSAGAVRAMADGVQAIRGMAEKRPDRADIS